MTNTELLNKILTKLQELRTEIKEFKEELNPVFNFFNQSHQPVTTKRLTKAERLEIAIKKQDRIIERATLARLKNTK